MTDLTAARNALDEAQQLLPAGLTARVLEPSAPAIDDGDFFADDPASLGDADPASTVRPLSEGDSTWEQLAANDADLAAFARARGLGPWATLGPVPGNYTASRADFHKLAYSVVAAARHQSNGKFGLRFTAGGFGTPFFGNDRQVRMVGNVLVDQEAGEVRTHNPTSINDAAAFLSVDVSTVASEGDVPELGDQDRPLVLDPDTGAFLGNWYAFAVSVLEELRAETAADANPSRVQLWPGHFDPAIEIGNQDKGHRASIGASPGDHNEDEPYLYIGPWGAAPDSDYWNAEGFTGAVLSYADLIAAEDQRAAALAFYRRGIALLAQL